MKTVQQTIIDLEIVPEDSISFEDEFIHSDYYSFSEVKKIARAYAKEALRQASIAVSYPYKDEYGCNCDVPSIVLNIINQLK